MSPGRWIVLRVRVPSEELTGELAEGLVALGGLAVEQEKDLLTTYIAEPEDPAALLERAADRLGSVTGVAPRLIWRWQDDEDWAARWKWGLAPRRVGDRILVTQPWNPVEPEGDDLVVVIDPSSAFGTGEHPTTRGALRLLEAAVAGGERVLDVGAGSAILSIVAAGLGAARVVGVESDAGAMVTAAANVARAGCGDRVELRHGVVDDAWLTDDGGGYDLIVANVMSGVLLPLLPGFRKALRPGGGVILGGIMTDDAGAMRAAAAAAGLGLVVEDVEESWWTALFRPHPTGP